MKLYRVIEHGLGAEFGPLPAWHFVYSYFFAVLSPCRVAMGPRNSIQDVLEVRRNHRTRLIDAIKQ